MKCPFCQQETKVYNSRATHQETQTWRRRQCLECHKAFTTREKVDLNGTVKVHTPGETAPYSQERLLLSLVRASDKLALPPGMLTELADSVELELQNKGFFEHSPQEAALIIEATTAVFHRYDQNLALLYVTNVYKNKPPEEVVRRLLAP